MGVITETIRSLLADAVRDHGLVLWFDPDRHYEGILTGLDAGQDSTLRFDGSYYALRLEAEPHLRGLDPPKMLVYLPVTYKAAEEPLAEMLALGVALQPGVPGSRNTRLAVVARKALKGRVPDSRLEDLDQQIEKGGLTLAELEEWAGESSGASPLPTVLAVLFETEQVDEAALEFLARPERDAELAGRNGLADWVKALQARFALAVDAAEDAPGLRSLLARHALACDLLEVLGEKTPAGLASVSTAKDPAVRKRAADLARAWRNRRDIASSYPKAADDVERALHLNAFEFGAGELEAVETFRGLERQLLRQVAAGLEAEPELTELAARREEGYWASQDGALQVEWGLVMLAGRLLACAREVEAALKAGGRKFAEYVEQYTREGGWSELDTLHRRLEHRWSNLEMSLADATREVEALVVAARRRHEEVAGLLAERFVQAWQAEEFAVSGLVRQNEIYERFVAPSLTGGRVAYVLVDALRWELARELPALLGAEFEMSMEVAIGTAPSITEVGMAALLPSASTGLRIEGGAKLRVSLHGEALKDRKDRVEYLRRRAGIDRVVDLKLEEPGAFRRKLKDLGGEPALIVVTSREIDQSGEKEMTDARDHMERVLRYLGAALRRLAEDGVERFVIAADHGYVFGEHLAESQKIDPPGGKTVTCHRRVWLGSGGAASANYLLTEASKFGASSELEMAVPWNLCAFRTPGPTAYFHGGLSPQEILLPVIVATPKGGAPGKSAKKLDWTLEPGSAKITSRYLSVQIAARATGLFAENWPIVRVEVRSGAEICSKPVSGGKGYQEATGGLVLSTSATDPAATEPNTMTLMLTEKAPSRGTVSIHLLDAVSGVELKKREGVEVSIAF
jgi:hypothetical protein